MTLSLTNIAGAIGISGISGFSGYSGTLGSVGPTGLTGSSGWSGYSGAVGISGFSGYSGQKGLGGIETDLASYSANITINVTGKTIIDLTLEGSPTIDFTGAVDGQPIVLRLRQDGVGNRTVTFGTSIRFSADLPSITISSSPSALDYLSFRYNATNNKYDVMAYNRGF